MRFVMINLLLVCLLLLGITYFSFGHIDEQGHIAGQHLKRFSELISTDPDGARKELDAYLVVAGFHEHPLAKALKELMFRTAQEGGATIPEITRLMEIKKQIRTDIDPEKHAVEIKMLTSSLEQIKLVAKMYERDGKANAKIPFGFGNADADTKEKKNPSDASEASHSVGVGKPAMDFQVTDLKGQALSLKKYRGKVVLLDFWATWCIPCKVETPYIKKVYDRYKDQKFEVIGISLDRGKPELEAYIKEENITWPQYLDTEGTVAKMYNVTGIPATFLIDREGVVRKVGLRGDALETAVAELVMGSKPSDSTADTVPDGGHKKTGALAPEGKGAATEPEVPYDVEVVKAGFADYNAYLETDPERAYQCLDDAFREQYGDDPDVDILVQHIRKCNDGVETVDGAIKNSEAMVRLVSKLPTPPEAIEAINLHLEYLKEMKRKAREAGIDEVEYKSRHTIGQ